MTPFGARARTTLFAHQSTCLFHDSDTFLCRCELTISAKDIFIVLKTSEIRTYKYFFFIGASGLGFFYMPTRDVEIYIDVLEDSDAAVGRTA